jgi:AbiV family abortive infection protein
MANPADSFDRDLLSQLASGATKAFANAEALFREAEILRKAAGLSRSLFLHQISLEECAKVEMLGEWATSLLMGHNLDTARMTKALSSHAHKNRTNAYSLNGTEEEASAKQARDYDRAQKAFYQMREQFHRISNTAKNASLYVDFADEKFIAPAERITDEMVSEIASLNEDFLKGMAPKLEMLQGWASNPRPIADELVGFEKRIDELPEKYSDPLEAMNILLQEMLDRRLRTLKETGASK